LRLGAVEEAEAVVEDLAGAEAVVEAEARQPQLLPLVQLPF
jgi:hypothetical protein